MAALPQEHTLFPLLFVLCMTMSVSSHRRPYTVPNVPRLTGLFPRVSVDRGFSKFFGAQNIQMLNNGSYANLALNKSSGEKQPSLSKFTTNELIWAPHTMLHTINQLVMFLVFMGFALLYAGSGLVSRSKYRYGFFSAAIKLPAGLSSGVVVAFYLSNADTFPHSHDEIDIELLGHDKRNDWVLQTNIYSSGSVSTGREEKFYFWFDPTQEQHYYSIIWNSHHVVFFVDNVPVREFPSSGAFSSTYPSKPMSVYATIWDGSQWATHGGKYPVNYRYAPFVVSLAEVEMVGCVSDPGQQPLSSCSNKSPSSSSDPVEGQDFAALSQQQITAMHWARSKLMFYSYCKDTSRFKVMPPECK